ncbi:ribokinase [Georgenia subflava]|uniref:Ribokinase n=1 Tax=Georgenia subflava TaxID=1622177 RepID=A0A6N7EJA8_9MICO|nr:ribokinase [Georgenia subflava]MPV36276.1 ribokinase [Georgenia subflava]
MVDVAVVGSLNLDLVVSTAAVPVAGETILARGHRQGLGGKGGNQAVAAARLGAAVAMVARIGEDAAGSRYLDLLDREHVDRRAVTSGAGETGLAVVLVEDTGENRILVSPGGNAALSPADVTAAGETVGAARVVLAQLEVPLATVTAAFRLATGTRILNAAPPTQLPAELLDVVDVLVVNETELAAVAGAPVPRDPAEAAEVAARTGCRGTVVVTLGERGSVARTPDGRWWHEPARPVTAVDTTAAGDAFCGALAVELGRGTPLDEALSRATLVGAVTVSRPGAIDSLPTAADLISEGQTTT